MPAFSVNPIVIASGDQVFFWTLIVLFVGALTGSMLKHWLRDRCLLDFSGYPVTLLLKEGKHCWGRLDVYTTGLELSYPEAHEDREGHKECSWILYAHEYSNIQAIYRIIKDCSPLERQRRETDLKKTYQPTLWRRAYRVLRNIVNQVRDACLQSIHVSVGYFKKQHTHATWLQSGGDKEVTKLGSSLIQYATTAYEPILEKYIGYLVVVEVLENNTRREYVGILKDYSTSFIELLNVKVVQERHVALQEGKQSLFKRMEVRFQENVLTLINHGDLPEQLCLTDESTSQEIVLSPNDEKTIQLPTLNQKTCIISRTVTCDVLFPRNHGVVRHAGENRPVSWREMLGLDELPLLKHISIPHLTLR